MCNYISLFAIEFMVWFALKGIFNIDGLIFEWRYSVCYFSSYNSMFSIILRRDWENIAPLYSTGAKHNSPVVFSYRYKNSTFWYDFQAQQNSLVQVARSLGRAVPLSPQLILTPTATVAAVQPEASSQSVNLQSTSPQVPETCAEVSHNYTKHLHNISQYWGVVGFFFFLHSSQMQNLVLCSQQGAVASSSSSSSTPQPQLHGLNVRHSSGGTTQIALPSLPVPQLKSLSSQAQGLQGAKNGLADASSEPAKMSDGANEMSTRVISMSHNMSTTNHPLINTGKKAINTYSVCRITNWILFCHPALILIMKWNEMELVVFRQLQYVIRRSNLIVHYLLARILW